MKVVVNISLTDRSGFVDDNKAVSGDVTLDVVVPAVVVITLIITHMRYHK